MKDAGKMLWVSLLSVAVLVGICGCEGGGGGSDSNDSSSIEAADTADVAGTWIATTSNGETASLIITQDGQRLKGTYFSTSDSRGNLSGTVSGNTVQLTLQETNYQRIVTELTGTVSGNKIKGMMNQSDGNSGSFSGTKQ